MSDANQEGDRIVDDSTRRSFMRKGALTTAAAGLAASGTVAAQVDEDDDELVDDNQLRIAMFQSDFRGRGRFILTSDVIEWTPDVPANLGGTLTGFNTHIGTYLNTAERFLIFIAQKADLGGVFDEDAGYFVDEEEFDGDDGFLEPAVYELENRFSYYEGTDRIITAYAYPVEDDEGGDLFEDGEGVNDFLW